MDFNSIIEEYRKRLIVTDGGKKQYKIIKDFKGTYIGKEMAKEEKNGFSDLSCLRCC